MPKTQEHKFAYQLDQYGFFVGMAPCQRSPLEPGVWLIPGGAIAGPKLPDMKPDNIAWFDAENQKWVEFTPEEAQAKLDAILNSNADTVAVAEEAEPQHDDKPLKKPRKKK